MIFTESKLKGAFIIEMDKKGDERGFFARTWCKNEFEVQGLSTQFVQVNLAFNEKKGILRGMHYQANPHEEVKLVRCTRGALYDVIVDIRKSSPTYTQWIGVELTQDNYRMLYIPEGFAHGYQTLADHTEIVYQVSQFYSPNSEGGIRWDDATVNIMWPETAERIISPKDEMWPLLA